MSNISTKGLYNRVLEDIIENKSRVEAGKVNTLPLVHKNLDNLLAGIAKGIYYCVTASPKVGKSQFTDEIFVFNPLMFAFKHKELLRCRILYFTLEMSPEAKMAQALSHIVFMYSGGKYRIDPKDMLSQRQNRALSQEVIDFMQEGECAEFIKFFDERVTFIDSISNPTGIYKFLKDYASTCGKMHKKKVVFTDNKSKESYEREIDDYYEANDEEEYRIVILDHMSLITQEAGLSLHESISLLSSKYFVRLRNKYNYTIVAVQQQAASLESNDNVKLKRIRPSKDSLGDNKLTSRDFNVLIGLFSPKLFDLKEYCQYDIKKFGDHIRFVEVIADRSGASGKLIPFFFDGAVNFFKELPSYNNEIGLKPYYDYIDRVSSNNSTASVLFNCMSTDSMKHKIIKYVDNYCNSCIRLWKKYFHM